MDAPREIQRSNESRCNSVVLLAATTFATTMEQPLLNCSVCQQRLPTLAFTSRQQELPSEERCCAHCTRAKRAKEGVDPVLSPSPCHRQAPAAPTLMVPASARQASTPPTRMAPASAPVSPRSPMMSPRPPMQPRSPFAAAPAHRPPPVSPIKQRSTPVFHKMKKLPLQKKPAWSSATFVASEFEWGVKHVTTPVADLNAQELRESVERQYTANIATEAARQRLAEQLWHAEYAEHNPSFVHPRAVSSEERANLIERSHAYAEQQRRRRAISMKLAAAKTTALTVRRISAFTRQDVGKMICIDGDDVTIDGQPRVVIWKNPLDGIIWSHCDIYDGIVEYVAEHVGGNVTVGYGPGSELKDHLQNPTTKVSDERLRAAFDRNHAASERYRLRREELKKKIYPPDTHTPRLSEEVRQKAAVRLNAMIERKESTEREAYGLVLTKTEREEVFQRMYDEAQTLRSKHESVARSPPRFERTSAPLPAPSTCLC